MRFFEKVSFNKWYSDVPLIGLPNNIARMWHHDIPDPIVNIEKGTVIFHAPYQTTIEPGNLWRVPTGFIPVNSKESWGEVFVRIRNKSMKPLVIGRGELLENYAIPYRQIFQKAAVKKVIEMERAALKEC